MKLKKSAVFLNLLFLAACTKSPQQWKESQEPFQVQVFDGKAERLIECAKLNLSYKEVMQFSVSKDPVSKSLFLSQVDQINGTALFSSEFRQLPNNTTEVSTRGVPYLFGSIPPFSKTMMEVVGECSKQARGK